MFIPSFEIHQRMLTEYAGVWFVPSAGDDSHAILIKASTNVIKAVTKGCEVKLHFGLVESPKGSIVVSCLQISDDPDAPMTVANPHIGRSEQEALVAILGREYLPLFMFDELNRNVAEVRCKFSPSKAEVAKLIASAEELYLGEIDTRVSKALDSLQYTIDPKMQFDAAISIPLVTLLLELTEARYFNLIGYSLNDGEQRFNVMDSDEGKGLEQSVWQLIDDLFAGNTYRSPQTVDGGRLRELTDVLALTDKGTFLFESKAAGILSAPSERSSSRRANNLEGQIKKALKQLIGGIKAVRKGEQVFSVSGRPVVFSREIVPHGIVLISEMLPSANWSEISQLTIDAARDCKAFIHILDLSELLIMVGSSKTAYYLDYFFIKRFETLVKQNNALFRMRFRISESFC